MASLDSQAENKWFPGQRGQPGARIRLFCFPYAGGSFTAFRGWQAELSSDIDVRAVELPGRISRLREEPFRALAPMLDALMRALAPHTEEPFAFFGYSMGALIAFELARRFARDRRRAPSHLFVAARPAPQLSTSTAVSSRLPDAELLDAIQRNYRPIPELALRDAGMRAGILSMMRADLAIMEGYSFQAAPPLRCPMTAFGATCDPLVDHEALAAWSEHTSGPFDVDVFPGDHFFLETQQSAMLRAVRSRLAPR